MTVPTPASPAHRGNYVKGHHHMIEGLPLPLEVGIYGLGWALFGSVVWAFYRKITAGDLVTRREADALSLRAEKAEKALDKALDQNGELMDMARLGSATWQALKKAADE